MKKNKSTFQQIVVAGVIADKQNSFLIVRRPDWESIFPGYYELPSGKKEAGEKTFEALRREVREETGISFSDGIPFHVFDYTIEKDEFVRETTQINFLINEILPTLTKSFQVVHQTGKGKADTCC